MKKRALPLAILCFVSQAAPNPFFDCHYCSKKIAAGLIRDVDFEPVDAGRKGGLELAYRFERFGKNPRHA